jgi:release factor glutamine methyltransferase
VRTLARQRRPPRGLEIGTGSGVVLAAMLAAGCAQAVGVELEPAAVERTRQLLAETGLQPRGVVRQGHLWEPVQGERFDLIACNLPQFPVLQPLDDDRLRTWSDGGPDGRAVIDPCLQGLHAHLAPGGVAVMTHNRFIDVARTRRRLAGNGLQARVVCTVTVPLTPQKLLGLNPAVLQRGLQRGLHRVGKHWFAEFQVLDIRHRSAPAARG